MTAVMFELCYRLAGGYHNVRCGHNLRSTCMVSNTSSRHMLHAQFLIGQDAMTFALACSKYQCISCFIIIVVLCIFLAASSKSTPCFACQLLPVWPPMLHDLTAATKRTCETVVNEGLYMCRTFTCPQIKLRQSMQIRHSRTSATWSRPQSAQPTAAASVASHQKWSPWQHCHQTLQQHEGVVEM